MDVVLVGWSGKSVDSKSFKMSGWVEVLEIK